MAETWEHVEDSMLYPPNRGGVSYFLWRKRSPEQTQWKMVLAIDTPTDSGELHAIRCLADDEFSAVVDLWAGEIVSMIEGGEMTFDLVFADQLVDLRKLTR